MSETVTVADGDDVEQVDVVDTFEHRGEKVLQVEGENLSGFVFDDR